MKRDELHLIIRNDTNLLLYGAVELQKEEKNRYHDIRGSLRCLAKLLIEFRKQSNNSNARAEDMVLSENFDKIVSSAKFLTGYRGPRDIDNPNTFCKFGFSLHNLVLIVRAVSLKENNSIRTEKCRIFLELCEPEWRLILANNARATYDCKKAKAPEKLPLEDDVVIFRSFLVNEIEKICEKFVVKEYRYLQKLTLARLMSFNARRGGEVSKLQLSDWEGVKDDRWKRRNDIDQIEDEVVFQITFYFTTVWAN